MIFSMPTYPNSQRSYDTLEPRGRELADTMLDRHLSAVADVDALALYP
jgi:hypothetical protein